MSTLIPAGLIADLRTGLVASLPDTATTLVYGEQLDAGGTGAPEQGYPSTGPQVACRVSGASRKGESEEAVALALQGIATYIITMPAGTLVGHRDRVRVNGSTFEVIGTDGASSWNIGMRVLVKEIT